MSFFGKKRAWAKSFYFQVYSPSHRFSTRGLSLIEVILAITIFATAIPAIGYLFGTAFKQESENTLHTQASFLANALMDEISKKAFREDASNPGNCADAGEVSGFDRRQFDDIDDYAIFTKSCGAVSAWNAVTPPRDESGTAQNDYAKFSQSVGVVNVSPPTAGPTARANYNALGDGTTDFKLVTVTISWNDAKDSVKLYKVFALH